MRLGDVISSEADGDDFSNVFDSPVVAVTGGDVAMKVVSVASQYFLPHFTDSERDHVRAPAAPVRAFI